MSYIDNKSAFVTASGIQEMSVDEIDQVEGALFLALLVVGVVIAGCYYAGRRQGNC